MRPGEVTLIQNNPETARLAETAPWHENTAACLAIGAAIMAVMPPPPATVLECGCWNGWLCHLFARANYKVRGMDACEDALGYARRAEPFGEEETRPEFFTGNFEESMGDGDPVDVVIFNSAFHHSEHPEQTLKAVYAGLAPGGRCIFVEPGIGHTWSPQTREHARQWDVTEKDTPPVKIWWLGRKAGFRKIKVYPHPGTLFQATYSPSGFAMRPSLKFLSNWIGGLISCGFITAKWGHGMTVLYK